MAASSSGSKVVGSGTTGTFLQRWLRLAYEDKARVIVWISTTKAAAIDATLTVTSTSDGTGFSRTILETEADTVASAVKYEGEITVGSKAASDISVLETTEIEVASTSGAVTVYGRSVISIGLEDETMTI
jgi:hypothetical protein